MPNTSQDEGSESAQEESVKVQKDIKKKKKQKVAAEDDNEGDSPPLKKKSRSGRVCKKSTRLK